jgi:1-acyl-sn-glycerol-3-phosphate acyltransferase
MLKTSLFFLIFWLGLLLSLILLLGYYLLKFSGLKTAEKQYVYLVTSRWARFTLFTAGIKLNVSGRAFVPGADSGFVVISNHQGNFDIPVFLACLPFTTGFISKKELMRLPFLSSWMRALNCLPIDRKNPRDSREKLIERIKRRDKNPIFLFPEGTRSRGPEMGPFRTGSLKLIFLNQIDVLPVTINDSFMCYEKYGKIRGGSISVIFHPLVKTSLYDPSGFEKFNADLREVIASQPDEGYI